MCSVDEVLLSLKPMDLVRLNGRLRIVRETSIKLNTKGKVSGCLTFSIMRCSWTKRPYTIKNVPDIRAAGIELVARSVKLKHGLSAILDKDVKKQGTEKCDLTACDVVGILI